MGNEPKIPTFLAVGFWAASALAVATYTWTAIKETASGVEKVAVAVEGAANPLVAGANILSAELGATRKPLTRGRFKH